MGTNFMEPSEREVNEYAYTLIQRLMDNHYTTYKLMAGSDHNSVSDNFLSEWHIEGSVWTHTMMVMSHMKQICVKSPNWKLLLIAGLLHDIGKPSCRFFNKEKNRVTFYGHPGVSTLFAVDLLDDIEPNLSHDEKIYVLRLINYHQVLFGISNNPSEKAKAKLISKFNSAMGCRLLTDVNIHRKADYYGNLARMDDGVGYDIVSELLATYVNTKVDEVDEVDEVVSDPIKPTAYIMIGLPGAGKSTFIANNFPNYPVVSSDNCLMRLGEPDQTYNEKFQSVDRNAVEALFKEDLKTALENKKDFMFDRTNLTHKTRFKYNNRFRQAGFNIENIVLLPHFKVAHLRNSGRVGKEISFDVIMTMAKSIELPFENEGLTHYMFDY